MKPPNPHSTFGSVTVIHIRYKDSFHDCFVDTLDYPVLRHFRWNVKPDSRTWYAFTSDKTVYMHHMLVGKDHDHKNGNGLDNRRDNLRPATMQQQQYNRRKRVDAVTSQYKGVHFKTTAAKWVAKINGKHLGYFQSEIGAALAYNEAAQNLHGPFAVLNIIGG